MAGRARIVLFTWVRFIGAVNQGMPLDMRSMPPGSPVPGRDPDPSGSADDRMVGWRVIGANNRELGRGARPYWLVQEAYQAIHEAQVAIDRMTTRFWTNDAGQWFWNVSLDDEQIATSSRGYTRQRECVFSAAQFRRLLPGAKTAAPHIAAPRATVGGQVILPSIVVAPRPRPVVGPTREVTT
jgi:hypothetical protein